MNTFLDPGSIAILADHSDARRRAREERAAEVRSLVLAAIAPGERPTIWQVTRAIRATRPDVGYVDIVVALAALGADGVIAGDADGYRRR